MDGGPRKHAAVIGRHNSNPEIVRIGSNASKPCVSSSPRTRPRSVTTPTIVMYTRVNGKIALYFLSVSDTADFSGSSLTLPFTFDLPVAVFLVLDDF